MSEHKSISPQSECLIVTYDVVGLARARSCEEIQSRDMRLPLPLKSQPDILLALASQLHDHKPMHKNAHLLSIRFSRNNVGVLERSMSDDEIAHFAEFERENPVRYYCKDGGSRAMCVRGVERNTRDGSEVDISRR